MIHSVSLRRSPRSLWRSVLALALVASVAACSNYDFSKARLPDGSYDMKVLAADLAAMDKVEARHGLYSKLWIPFLYSNVTGFARNSGKGKFPKGYVVVQGSAYGPLGLVHSFDVNVVDPQFEPIEKVVESSWVWSLARYLKSAVATEHGMRVALDYRWVFGLFGGRQVAYRSAKAK